MNEHEERIAKLEAQVAALCELCKILNARCTVASDRINNLVALVESVSTEVPND